MIKLALVLLSVLMLSSAYKPVPNFDLSAVLRKPLYLNAILSTQTLNFTMDNYLQFCTGFFFSRLSDGRIVSMFTLLPNYTTSNSVFNPNMENEAVWESSAPLSAVQWQSLGSMKSFSSLTWVYADTYNDVYAVIMSGTETGDLFLVLNGVWDTRFTRLSKLTTLAMNMGFQVPNTGYNFMQCSGYVFDQNNYYPPYGRYYAKGAAAPMAMAMDGDESAQAANSGAEGEAAVEQEGPSAQNADDNLDKAIAAAAAESDDGADEAAASDNAEKTVEKGSSFAQTSSRNALKRDLKH